MRLIGLDLGDKRIGVASADTQLNIAIPLTTIAVDGDPVEQIARLVNEEHAAEIIVGLPLSMSGAIGPQAQRIIDQVEALKARLPVPIHTWDERLTSTQATRSATPRGRERSRRSKEMYNRDAVAAAIILQAYLDSRS